MNKRPQVLCLMGPTASGKTQLALQIAKEIPCEIISVDSAMVYRTMDIGTAKPSFEQKNEVVHHLIDIRDPADPYSAAEFMRDAISLVDSIHARQRVPLFVGGTMLYFRAFQEGLSPLPSANLMVRAKLSSEAQVIGWPAMHSRLAHVDPIAASRINPSDPQRIQRALEVYELTGKPMTAWWQDSKTTEAPYQVVNMAIAPPQRALLHARIAARFEFMLAQGFIAEVEKLYLRGDLHMNLPSIRSVGYRQVWKYLQGQWQYSEMIERATAATRQLAKRQLTWLRRWNSIQWFDSEDPQVIDKILVMAQHR
jgi:tRNA dimethylallyltransferase